MGTHAQSVPTHRRRTKAGVPYLWYLDPVTKIGFAWTGLDSDPVEICQGSPKVTNITTTTPDGVWIAAWISARTPRSFKLYCDLWLQAIDAGQEPRMVQEIR